MALENTAANGYTTEKILHAYMSNCIPIYWGNDNVEQDFNKETMICVRDYGSVEEAIEYIKKVDNDEELYNSYMNKPIFSKTWIDRFTDPEEKFFKNVINENSDDMKTLNLIKETNELWFEKSTLELSKQYPKMKLNISLKLSKCIICIPSGLVN